jgi:uncharacterized protein YacL
MALKLLLRLLFIVFVASFSVYILTHVSPDPENIDPTVAALYAAVAGFIALALVLFEWRLQKYFARELVAVMVGLGAGLLLTALILLVTVAFYLPSVEGADFFDSIGRAFEQIQPAIPLILAGCCYLCITIVIQTRNDFRFLIPYIDFSSRGTQEGGFVLDTSAIIDGRIVDICETMILATPLVIPDFVIRELQSIADSPDRLRRLRGRRGLDMVARLQKSEAVRVSIRETQYMGTSSVDDQILQTAKDINGRVITTDFNLNKVSQIEGVAVININDLANAVKPAVLPGEDLTIKIIRPGQEPGQGVGYLEDGTMVVVENARDRIGENLRIYVTGSIQTSAGRMIFGKPADEENGGGGRR